MSDYTQDNRLLALTTPLGPNALLPVSLHGREDISRLFGFAMEWVAPLGQAVPFERILGQSVTAALRQGADSTRYFNGIVSRFSECGRDTAFTRYRAQVVPKLWLLTRTRRCRIFQHLSTPDILRRVLEGLEVTYSLLGTYAKRNYCVQYQETDFDFISRLMEEDGIFYYFTHTADGHQLVLSDATRTHPRLPDDRRVVFGSQDGATTGEWQVAAWEKTQELRSGRTVLRDHSFELPGDPLEAAQTSLDRVAVGTATHRLRGADSDRMELYEYPGGYARQHDRVAADGQAQAADLSAIFEHRDRTLRIRMEAEECASLRIDGQSNCGMFAAGTKFDLQTGGDAAGAYLLAGVEHHIQNAGWRTEDKTPASYANSFTCLPAALPYRPARVTARPRIEGFQTATVVGPQGEELFCDRYGRVKVQFHWDREGQADGRSSCWLRVAQIWAGKGWGAFFWPRIGHEVVVAFEDGDPDCPMVTGSVYNAANMPPYAMPACKELGGIRSASERSSARQHFNSVVFNDEKGVEHLAIHSERNLSLNSEYDKMIHAGRHKGERVANSSMLAVGSMPGTG